ncbi:MAG: cyclic lactone autoinducer peptide [Opitutaceae bacterium]|nr:cyclic lactone autoinducer peptide [Cephaloticoccus sp.]MCP5529018.1 cyclic lactone autoinducer peptide [Opitutaceae bacterium]
MRGAKGIGRKSANESCFAICHQPATLAAHGAEQRWTA